ncbi:hypothetical protein GCM10011506_38430 [Marivirga lumbricoides]|uniref:histidine kinase n=1 Tax=Marivirga lumbricoides TaxID=1046115 RepID=A0ABQ1N517_9BACT|nr:hypothetical protein GCM10011506_38430 [Marivirga lumbricoides]
MEKKQFQILIPIAIIVLSFLVIVGWLTDIGFLLSLIPGAPTMKFNTALLFILISFSIIMKGNKNKVLDGLAIVFAVVTFLISTLTLAQYILAINIGVDNFFLADSLTQNNPGRMSGATAFCFMLLSATKILRGVNTNKALKLTHYFVSLVAIISLLAISTYLLRLITDNYVLVFNSMAIHTSVLFFLASLTISLKHPDHSYIGFLTGKYIGSKQARSLLPFVVGLPIILSAALLYVMNSGFLNTAYGVALYTIAYAVISIIYFSVIFTKLNKSDQKRFQLEENLRVTNEELSQYKLALDQSSIVIKTDVNGIINYVNKKFVEISGYSEEEAIGQTHRLVNSGHHSEAFFTELWQTIEKGTVWIGGIKNKTKSGDFYWVHVVIVPLRDKEGKIEQFLSIKQDITQKTILSNQYENLKLKNKEIEQFTFIASHDLQEPLKTLKSMSDLLQKEYADKLEGNGGKMLQFIFKAAHRMSDLVKGLLEYSIIGINKELERVHISMILEDVKNDITELIVSNNASVDYSDLPELNVYPTELRLLFQNLIQNAIKFKAAERAPEIIISAEKEQHSYKFCVKDNGIGISEDQLTNVFGLFKRLHDKRVYEGTGIGLAHCEKIVHLHGGTIWAESEIGKGSSFFFTIPIF